MEQNMRFCTGCGHSIPNGVVACPYCGKPATAQPPHAPQHPPIGQMPPGHAPMYVPGYSAAKPPKTPEQKFHLAAAITMTVVCVLLLLFYIIPIGYNSIIMVEATLFPISMVVYLLSLIFLPLYTWLRYANVKIGGKSFDEKLPMSIPVAIIAAFTVKWLDMIVLFDGSIIVPIIITFVLHLLMNAYGIVAWVMKKKQANPMPTSPAYVPYPMSPTPTAAPTNVYVPVNGQASMHAYAAPATPAQSVPPVAEPAVPIAVPVEAHDATPAPAAPASPAFCTGCGKQLAADANFCVSCGKTVKK